MKSESPRPIFIVGCPRSGNTLLACILSRHPALLIFFERGVFASIYRRWAARRRTKPEEPKAEALTEVLLNGWQHWITQRTSLRVQKDELLRAMENGRDDQGYGPLLDRCMTALMHQVKPEARRWGDKTPQHVGAMTDIQKVYPEAQFVHVRRDPRSVVASLSKPSFGPASDDSLFNVNVVRQYWAAYQNQKRHVEEGRIFELRHEDIVERTEETLTALCDFLGVEYTSQLIGEADEAVRRASGWPSYKGWGALEASTASPPELRPAVRAGLRPLAEEMGYPVLSVGVVDRMKAQFQLAPIRLLHRGLSAAYRRRYPVANTFFLNEKPSFQRLKRWVWGR